MKRSSEALSGGHATRPAADRARRTEAGQPASQRVEVEVPTQRRVVNEIASSARMVAQRRQLDGSFGPTVQRQGAEDEELMQGKAESALQLQGGEEEELMQGRFKTLQRAGEEEELMQGRFTTVQRASEEEEPLQGRFRPGQGTVQAQADGAPDRTGMPAPLRAGIESMSGMDMSDVRVHSNSSEPAKVDALAFAQGNAIHVAPGQEEHLPHEAWHVVQQRQGRVEPTRQLQSNVAINDDPGLEREADVMGARALRAGERQMSENGGE